MCLAEFEFFLISYQEGLRGQLDGILGLSRADDNGAFESDSDGRGVGPNFVRHLLENELVEDDIFAFYLESYHDENGYDRFSYVDFGEI